MSDSISTSVRLSPQTLQGREDWQGLLANPGERDHTVQLYSDLRFLTNAVCHYTSTGLWKGEAVLLVATSSHREAFAQRLQMSGINVRQRIDIGQLTILDAQETLSRVLVDGRPDPASFLSMIGSIIDLARIRGGYPRVRAYGEMVNLLWEKGELAAAVHLEELWNELSKTRPFCLHCAYAMDVFDPMVHQCHAIEGVHHTHSHVIAAESNSLLDVAVNRAVIDVLGADRATAILQEFVQYLTEKRAAATQQLRSPLGEPSSEPMILALPHLSQVLTPELAKNVLLQARHYYDQDYGRA